MRISDWSSDVCSSDLPALLGNDGADFCAVALQRAGNPIADPRQDEHLAVLERREGAAVVEEAADLRTKAPRLFFNRGPSFLRSEEHTSELQSLMRISYAVFCLKKKKNKQNS